MQGKIHSIETFSTLDGPGIRMVVFLQGCSLRCLYCQNPDTWDPHADKAIAYSNEDLLALIKRGRNYYQPSGGGLTFSGGEPLLQHCFVGEVFKLCQQEGFHTALDSSLYISPSRLESVLPYTDLVLADIKHVDPEQSRQLTGQYNDLNLNNLKVINAAGTALWIRYVVVPGYTDSKADIVTLGNILNPLDTIERIELLPYHTLGVHKWELLKRPYLLKEIKPPEQEKLQCLQDTLAKVVDKRVYIA